MKTNLYWWVPVTMIAVIAQSGSLTAETIGRTWPIAEQDILTVIEKKAAKVSINPNTIREKIENHVPRDNVYLPRATESRQFSPDMSYTLTFDITDAQGKVIYPKGYRFDPMPYIRMPVKIIIFNPDDPEQMNWYQQKFAGDMESQVLVTRGKYKELSEKLKRNVYYLPEVVVDRFQLKAVPTIIRQQNNRIVVNEIDTNENN